MSRPMTQALRAFLSLFAVTFALLFLPAWTWNYWQAWTYLAVLMASIGAILIYLVKNDPALLARRTNNTEEEASQKVIHFLVNLTFLAAEVLPALDHRFGWSAVPTYLVIAGDGL